MRLALLVSLSAVATPCAADELLDRARSNFARRLEQTPSFTCVLEIEREVFAGASDPWFDSRDRARLEVSVVDGLELFAWPGDSFKERPLTDFLGPGVASTGEFSLHGRTVLTDGRTSIEGPVGEPEQGLVRYRFRVPVDASRYVVMSTQGPVASSYEGDFWIDESTAEVVRLELRVGGLPASVGVRRSASSVEFGKARVGDQQAWLPLRSELEVESVQGPVARNKMTFSSCRAYATEATITFGEEAEDAQQVTSAAEAWAIPEGLDLRVELRDDISSDRAWAGDSFTAEVYRDVKKGGEVLLAKGDRVGGRVVRIETVDTTPSAANTGRIRRLTAISLMLDEIRRDGRCAPLAATLKLVERMPLMGRISPGGGADIDRSSYSTNRAATYDTAPQMSEPGFGTFIVHGELYMVRKGTRMRWTTTTAAEQSCEDR